MPINIQSLFQDIIETPAQRQQRMLQEGILKGRELTAGLTGLARTQAPLVSALMMNMPKRQEALRRGVGGMLGLDVRSESEKVQDALKNVDPNNPQSLLQAAQMIQDLGLGAQAAQLRQMAAQTTQENTIAQQQIELNKLRIEETKQNIDIARTTEERESANNLLRSQTLALQNALAAWNLNDKQQELITNNANKVTSENTRDEIVSYINGLGDNYAGFKLLAESSKPEDLPGIIEAVSKLSIQNTQRATPEYKPLSNAEKEEVNALAKENPVIREMIKDPIGKDPEVSQAALYERVAVYKAISPGLSTSGILNIIANERNLGIDKVNEEDIVRGIMGDQQQTINLDAAAADLAAQQPGAISQAQQNAPKNLSKEEINAIGFIPTNYTLMTSGKYKLQGNTSPDFTGNGFRKPTREEIRKAYPDEVRSEYQRLKGTSSGKTDLELFNLAAENILNNKYPQ